MNQLSTTLGGTYVSGNNMPLAEAEKRFSALFKAKRLAMNITQKELAEHIGVSATVIKRLESGKPINSQNLLKIMIALEMFKQFVDVLTLPEISLKAQWDLKQKHASTQRKRASATKR